MLLSVLTPTYNRADLLPRLRDSLLRQSDADFEWVIVDDGSTDETESLCKNWEARECSPNIQYHKAPHGGKHRALNRGIPLCHGAFVLIVDSDDYLTDDAVGKIRSWIAQIEEDSSFAGVSGCRGYDSCQRIGEFPTGKAHVDCTNLERRKYRLRGDKAEVYRKSLLLRYPFPEFDGEMFLGEGAVWNRIAEEGYKIRWFRDILCVCNYLKGGLSKTADKELQNFRGFEYNMRLLKDNQQGLEKLSTLQLYYTVAKLKGLSFSEIRNAMDAGNLELILALCLFRPYRRLTALCNYLKRH